MDAIQAREKRGEDFHPRVSIALEQNEQGRPTLTFTDSGVGLTEAEVHQFLATIILGREPLDVVDLKTVSGGLDGVALVLPWTLSLAARSGHVVHLKNMLLNEDAPDLAS